MNNYELATKRAQAIAEYRCFRAPFGERSPEIVDKRGKDRR